MRRKSRKSVVDPKWVLERARYYFMLPEDEEEHLSCRSESKWFQKLSVNFAQVILKEYFCIQLAD